MPGLILLPFPRVIQRVAEKKDSVKVFEFGEIQDVKFAVYLLTALVVGSVIQKDKHIDIIFGCTFSDPFQSKFKIVVISSVCKYGDLFLHGILHNMDYT